jgi:hypothetical protein
MSRHDGPSRRDHALLNHAVHRTGVRVARARLLSTQHPAELFRRVSRIVIGRWRSRSRAGFVTAVLQHFHSELRILFGVGVFFRDLAVDHRNLIGVFSAHGPAWRFSSRGARCTAEYRSITEGGVGSPWRVQITQNRMAILRVWFRQQITTPMMQIYESTFQPLSYWLSAKTSQPIAPIIELIKRQRRNRDIQK